MIFLITYDLKNQEKDYEKFYSSIKNLGHWWHYINNSWIVNTPKTLNECTDELCDFIDANDRLLIVDVSNTSINGWLPEEAWNWILRQKRTR